MRYKRQEGFRFVFNHPLAAALHVHEPGLPLTKDTCEILDLSLGGAKIKANREVKQQVPIEIDLIVQLNDTQPHPITLQGIIIWKEKAFSHLYYGIRFVEDEKNRMRLLDELKNLSKTKQ